MHMWSTMLNSMMYIRHGHSSPPLAAAGEMDLLAGRMASAAEAEAPPAELDAAGSVLLHDSR